MAATRDRQDVLQKGQMVNFILRSLGKSFFTLSLSTPVGTGGLPVSGD